MADNSHEAGGNQEAFEQLLACNFSPSESKAALKHCRGNLEQSKAWLANGGYEESAGQNPRLRKASVYDPNLVSELNNVENFFEDDIESVENALVNRTESLNVDGLSDEVVQLIDMGWQTFEGYLVKGSPSMFAGWQSRWFTLWEHRIFYFKDGQPVQKGIIDLREVEDIIILDDPTKLDIQMDSQSDQPGRIFHLQGDQADIASWYKFLKANWFRTRHIGITPELAALPPEIPLDQLHYEAHTGDLLLFSSRHSGGYIVQSATASTYDHIGILVRYGRNQVSVLEALGKHGVQLFKWQDFIREKWYSQYKAMAIRRLHIPDKNLRKKMLKEIAAFIREVVDCEYSWTPMKMYRRQSQVSQDLGSRSYFCSELVAKSYKLSGILRDTCSSGCYTPAMFDQTHNLQLMQGACLREEQLLAFSDET